MFLEFLNARAPLATSRRGFLLGAAAVAGGFAVGFRPLAALAEDAPAPINPLAAYVLITPDDKVTVISSQFDMGQGSYHGIATLVLEELGARWDQTDVVGGFGNPKLYGNLTVGGAFQLTGGSSSMASSWDRYRIAGAAAREMLVAAAADKWGVPAAEITVADGRITHPTAGSASFGELAEAAAAMPVPAKPALKEPGQWTLIGNAELRRYDSAPKTNGTQPYTIDVKLPGMLTATMIHPPKFGATVKSFDAAAAKAMPGIVDVVETPRGLAVVGENTWAAIKGRDAVTVEWDEAASETRGSEEILAAYRELVAGEPAGRRRAGGRHRVGDGWRGAGARGALRVPLSRPCGAGATERGGPDGRGRRARDLGRTPVAGLLSGRRRPGGGHHARQGAAACDEDRRRLRPARGARRRHHRRGGRRGAGDRLARARQGAVDPRGRHEGREIPAGLRARGQGGSRRRWQAHRLGAAHRRAIAPQGQPVRGVSWRTGSIRPRSRARGTCPMPSRTGPSGSRRPEVGVPVLWWRSVGSTHTAYVVETFLDELAEAAGADPLDFRLALLPPRHANVLRLAAEKAGWGTPRARGTGARPRAGGELPHHRRPGGGGQRRRGRRQGAQGGLRRRLRRADQSRQHPGADGGRHRLRARAPSSPRS